MHLSNNANKFPSVIASNSINLGVLVDGIYEPHLQFAFTDSDYELDTDARVMPIEWDESQIPWVSSTVSDSAGNFVTPEVVEVDYKEPVKTNKIVVVSDPFGPAATGMVDALNISIKQGGNWVLIAQNYNPGGYKGELYLQSSNGVAWGAQINRDFLTEITAIKVEILSVTVDSGNSQNTGRPRRAQLYEIDAAIEKDVSANVISWDVAKTRDDSSQQISPVGNSSANTLTITLENIDNHFNNFSDDSPYKGLLSVNVKFDVALGIHNGQDYEYIPQGIFYSDSWDVSNNVTMASVSCRDYSKFLQDRIFEDKLYEGYLIHEVIRDVVQLSGANRYEIDNSTLTLQDMTEGTEVDYQGVDEIIITDKLNLVWNRESSYWNFLQNVASMDLGVFYFDETGKFIYKTKESLIDTSRPEFQLAATLSENDFITDASYNTELVKNSFEIDYAIPKISKETVALWEADDPTILSSTTLLSDVDATSSEFKVQDITDWPEQGYFKIGNERVKYGSRNDNEFLECERGALSTAPEKHDVATTNQWTTTGSHTWEFGGVIAAYKDTAGGDWSNATTTRKFRDNFNISGLYRVTDSPWSLGIIFRATGNTYYRFLIRCTAAPGDEGGADPDGSLYILQKISNGSVSTIKKGPPRPKTLVDIWNTFEVAVMGNKFTLSVNNIKVMEHKDDSITASGGVGISVKGKGPTLVRDFRVILTPGNPRGESVAFDSNSGNVIYEIRKFEAEYSTSPANSIIYILTNDELAEVFSFNPGPFKADIFIQNNQDGYTLIEGTPPEEALSGLGEFFELVGRGVELESEQTLEKKDNESIKRFGEQEFDLSLEWVQSRSHAKALLDYLLAVYKQPIIFVTIEAFALPHLQIDDLVRVNYPRLGLNGRDFHVVEISTSFTGAISQSIILRSRADVTVPKIVFNDPIEVDVLPEDLQDLDFDGEFDDIDDEGGEGTGEQECHTHKHGNGGFHHGKDHDKVHEHHHCHEPGGADHGDDPGSGGGGAGGDGGASTKHEHQHGGHNFGSWHHGVKHNSNHSHKHDAKGHARDQHGEGVTHEHQHGGTDSKFHHGEQHTAKHTHKHTPEDKL